MKLIRGDTAKQQAVPRLRRLGRPLTAAEMELAQLLAEMLVAEYREEQRKKAA